MDRYFRWANNVISSWCDWTILAKRSQEIRKKTLSKILCCCHMGGLLTSRWGVCQWSAGKLVSYRRLLLRMTHYYVSLLLTIFLSTLFEFSIWIWRNVLFTFVMKLCHTFSDGGWVGEWVGDGGGFATFGGLATFGRSLHSGFISTFASLRKSYYIKLSARFTEEKKQQLFLWSSWLPIDS